MQVQLLRTILPTLVLTTLAACTDSSITAVKEASMRQSDFTYGEVFDEAKGCKSTAWKASDDADGRKVVEYTCSAALSDETLQKARQSGVEKAKDMSKGLTEAWNRTYETIESRRKQVGESLRLERSTAEAKLEELQRAMQEAQRTLETTNAKPPTAFIGHGPSGYTPKLIEWGEERKRVEVQKDEQRLATLQNSIALVQRELTGLQDPAQYRIMGGKNAAEYEQALQRMDLLKDKYFAAVAQLEASLLKQAQDHVASQEKRKLELKVKFLVPKKSAIEPSAANWYVDDQRSDSMGVVYLAAAIVKPSYLPQIIDKQWSIQLAVPTDSSKALESFGYRCDAELPAGCELRNPPA